MIAATTPRCAFVPSRALTLAFALAVAMVSAVGPSAAAEPERGGEIFPSRGARCHAISASEPGKRGPYLAGLFSRAPDAAKGFPYRMVFSEAGPVWTEAGLDLYLELHLLTEAQDRTDVAAFLRNVTAK